MVVVLASEARRAPYGPPPRVPSHQRRVSGGSSPAPRTNRTEIGSSCAGSFGGRHAPVHVWLRPNSNRQGDALGRTQQGRGETAARDSNRPRKGAAHLPRRRAVSEEPTP